MTATFTKLSGLLPRVAFIGFLFSVTTVSGQSVTFSELNYNSDSTTNSGSWVELYNYGTTTLDLTGWYLKDDNNANTFLFPSGTTITAGNRLVVVTDAAKFTQQYPGVTNYVGDIPFGFGNGGDQVRLFDNTFSLKVFMDTPIPFHGLKQQMEQDEPLSSSIRHKRPTILQTGLSVAWGDHREQHLQPVMIQLFSMKSITTPTLY
jgi:hypothetical protein